MKKWFLLSLIFISTFGYSVQIIACQQQNDNLVQYVINKISKYKVINIQGINLNSSLEATNTINAIENILQLTPLEKSIIKAITAVNNTLNANSVTNVTFMLSLDNNHAKITKPVILNILDNSTTKNYQVYSILNCNDKYYENTSNGIYVSNDANNFTKLNLNFSLDIFINSMYYDTYLYLETSDGVYVSTNKNLTKFVKMIFNIDSGLNHANIHDLWINGYNMYLAADIGLYVCDISEKVYNAQKILPDDILKIAYVGQLFAWSNNSLFISYDKVNFHLVTSEFTTYNLYIDNNLLYLCTSNGLFFANYQFSWVTYYQLSKGDDIKNNLGTNPVYDIQNIQNILYVATKNGLYYSYDHVNFVQDQLINNNPIFLLKLLNNNNLIYLIINSILKPLNNDSVGVIYYQI